MAEELITLAVEDSKAREAFARSNRGFEDLERRAVKAHAAIGASSLKAGEQMIRAEERKLSVTERRLRQLEREAQLHGKTGAEKIIIQQEQMSRAYGGSTAELERFNAITQKRIGLETQAAHAATLQAAAARASAAAVQTSAIANQAAGMGISGFIASIKAWHVAVVAAVATAMKLPKALFGLVSEMGKYAEGIENMAARTGLGVKQVEQLSAMASIAGVDVGVLERTAWRLAEALEDTGAGGKKARDTLRELGISALDAAGAEKALGAVQWEILQRLGHMTDETKRMTAAQRLYGRGSQELQPMLKHWDELEEKVRAAGLAMDEGMIRKLAEADDKVDQFRRTWLVLKGHLAEPLTAVIEVLTKVIEPGGKGTAPGTARQPMWGMPGYAAERLTEAEKLKRYQPAMPTAPGVPGIFAAQTQQFQAEIERGTTMAAAFEKARRATLEGLKDRLKSIEEEEKRLLPLLLPGAGVTGAVYARRKAEFDRLAAEKTDLEKRVEAIEELGRKAKEQAKLAEKGRVEIERYKLAVAMAAVSPLGAQIIEPAKFEKADYSRYQAAMPTKLTLMTEEEEQILHNLEKAGVLFKQVDEERLSALKQRANLEERLIQLQTGPGGELEAAERIYTLRLEYAEREFEIHKDRFKYEQSMEEAQIERVTAIAQLERKRFDDLKHAAEGIFDALLTRSESIGKAILNVFKVAILTPVKEAFSSMIAKMLMPLYGGRGVGGGGGGFSLAGLFGMGGTAAMAQVGNIVGGPGGTSGFAGPVGAAGSWMMYPGAPVGWNAAGGGTGLAMAPSWGAGLKGMGPAAAAMGGLTLGAYGLQRGGRSGELMTIGGGAALGYGMAGTMGMTGYGGAITGAAGGLAALGLQRGGITGLAMTTAGGAVIGMQFGGAEGAAIGAAIGFVAGLVRLFFKGAQEKAREKIRALYAVDIADKGILGQIIQMAKSGFGGNLDVAIRSPQIREMIQLYGMTVGQRGTGFPSQMQSLTFQQAGGRLYEVPAYSGGVQLPALTAPAAAAPTVINVNLDPGETRSFWENQTLRTVAANPRAINTASIRSNRQNFGRRTQAAQMLAPELVTS